MLLVLTNIGMPTTFNICMGGGEFMRFLLNVKGTTALRKLTSNWGMPKLFHEMYFWDFP
jgi:hypothetical protein